jgi:hypothetical protein
MGSGTQVNPGENAAWIEIDLNPRRTMIAGPVKRDKAETVLREYHSGFDHNDEQVKEIYTKNKIHRSFIEVEEV